VTPAISIAPKMYADAGKCYIVPKPSGASRKKKKWTVLQFLILKIAWAVQYDEQSQEYLLILAGYQKASNGKR